MAKADLFTPCRKLRETNQQAIFVVQLPLLSEHGRRGGRLLRQFGDHGFRREQQAGDRGGVLQSASHRLGGVDDALGHQVAVLAGLGVVAEVVLLPVEDLADHHRAVVARIERDLAARIRQRLADGCADQETTASEAASGPRRISRSLYFLRIHYTFLHRSVRRRPVASAQARTIEGQGELI
jgi:hypothetical protein